MFFSLQSCGVVEDILLADDIQQAALLHYIYDHRVDIGQY